MLTEDNSLEMDDEKEEQEQEEPTQATSRHEATLNVHRHNTTRPAKKKHDLAFKPNKKSKVEPVNETLLAIIDKCTTLPVAANTKMQNKIKLMQIVCDAKYPTLYQQPQQLPTSQQQQRFSTQRQQLNSSSQQQLPIFKQHQQQEQQRRQLFPSQQQQLFYVQQSLRSARQQLSSPEQQQ